MRPRLASDLRPRYAGLNDSLRSGIAVRRRRAPAIRSYLSEIVGDLTDKGASSEEIVRELKRRQPQAIAKELDDVVHIGLMKLASEAYGRRPGSPNSAQLELWEEY